MPKVKKEKLWNDFPALTRLLAEIALFRAGEQSQPSLPFETGTQARFDAAPKSLPAERPDTAKKKKSRIKDNADRVPPEDRSDQLF